MSINYLIDKRIQKLQNQIIGEHRIAYSIFFVGFLKYIEFLSNVLWGRSVTIFTGSISKTHE